MVPTEVDGIVKNWLKRNKRVHSNQLILAKPRSKILWDINGKTGPTGVFTSVKDLEEKINNFIEAYRKVAKPFIWTKSTEEILERVNPARKTPSNPQSV